MNLIEDLPALALGCTDGARPAPLPLHHCLEDMGQRGMGQSGDLALVWSHPSRGAGPDTPTPEPGGAEKGPRSRAERPKGRQNVHHTAQPSPEGSPLTTPSQLQTRALPGSCATRLPVSGYLHLLDTLPPSPSQLHLLSSPPLPWPHPRLRQCTLTSRPGSHLRTHPTPTSPLPHLMALPVRLGWRTGLGSSLSLPTHAPSRAELRAERGG